MFHDLLEARRDAGGDRPNRTLNVSPRALATLCAGAVLLQPSVALASDFSVFYFFVSVPICFVLVALTILWAATVRLTARWTVMIPMFLLGLLWLATLSLIPLDRVQGDVAWAYGLQALLSAGSLFALLVLRWRRQAPGRVLQSKATEAD